MRRTTTTTATPVCVDWIVPAGRSVVYTFRRAFGRAEFPSTQHE